MKGFDSKWRDFPDYILGITGAIWEGREVSGLHHCYADDNAVRTRTSIVRGNDHETGRRHADVLTRIMNAEMSAIPAEYDRACHLGLPGVVTGHGHAAADRFWMGLRASFPSAAFQIDHRTGRSDKNMPDRAAVRWSLQGRHDGWVRSGCRPAPRSPSWGSATPSSNPGRFCANTPSSTKPRSGSRFFCRRDRS